MARVFITGSSDGLGRMAATLLIKDGHDVVFHARNQKRASDLKKEVPTAKEVLIADLSNLEETKDLAQQLNRLSRFDAIIHNAGVYNVPSEMIVHVNTLAPYILTCLVTKPARLIYLSSGDHMHGSPNLENLANGARISYADSKLHDVMLAFAVARKYPTSTPTLSIPVGFLRKWVAVARLMTWTKATKHKRGSQQATILKHWLAVVTSFIKKKRDTDWKLLMSNYRKSSCRCARS